MAPPVFETPNIDCRTFSSRLTSPGLIVTAAVCGDPLLPSGKNVNVADCAVVPGLNASTSVCHAPEAEVRLATPASTKWSKASWPRGTAGTRYGSPLTLSTTEAYAVIFPAPVVTLASRRPSLREILFCARNELKCRCSFALSSTGTSSTLLPAESYALTRTNTG